MGVAASGFQVASWALAVGQTGLLHWLLRHQDSMLSAYAELARRLACVEQALDELTWGPAVLDPRPVPAGTPDDAIVYGTVKLKGGVRFEVAVDPRWMDPIADAIVAGDTWFLEDYYVLLDRLKPGDRVLDLGGHVGTFALAAAALGCRVVCVEAAPRLIRLLRASVARNGFDEVHIVHGAVTARRGGVGFIPSGPWGTIPNRVVEGQPSTIQARTLTPVVVPAVTVDLLLDEGWPSTTGLAMVPHGPLGMKPTPPWRS